MEKLTSYASELLVTVNNEVLGVAGNGMEGVTELLNEEINGRGVAWFEEHKNLIEVRVTVGDAFIVSEYSATNHVHDLSLTQDEPFMGDSTEQGEDEVEFVIEDHPYRNVSYSDEDELMRFLQLEIKEGRLSVEVARTLDITRKSTETIRLEDIDAGDMSVTFVLNERGEALVEKLFDTEFITVDDMGVYVDLEADKKLKEHLFKVPQEVIAVEPQAPLSSSSIEELDAEILNLQERTARLLKEKYTRQSTPSFP